MAFDEELLPKLQTAVRRTNARGPRPFERSPRAPKELEAMVNAFGELVPGSDRDWHLRFLITRRCLDHLFFEVEVGQAPVQPLR
jgi:hypothetical protein